MRFLDRAVRALIGVAAATAIVLGAPGIASATVDGIGSTATKLSHADAAARLSAAGVAWTSSGGCSDRNQPNCTSFTEINLDTILGAITLQQAGGCALTITGGTETGHADGTYSHWNGYKLDFRMTSCLTNWVQGHYTPIGGSKWQSGSGNIYFHEGNHWDVTYYNCGGC